MHAWTFDAIGTAWQIDTPEPLAADVRADVLARIEAFDLVWSRFREDSLVTRMAQRAGSWPLPDEADDLLGLFAQLHEATDGAVDPLVGQTLVDLGYDADYTLTPTADPPFVPDELACRSTLVITRGESVPWALETSTPMLLDVGAAGKGLLVDLVSAMVPGWEFTVDASGDMYHDGTAPIRVAMEHPADATQAIGVVTLDPETALCASATNRRAWGDGLHHVIDARTGRPTTDVVATWVVADSCMLADGLATAHFFAEPDRLVPRFRHEYARMHADGRVEWSPDFPGELFT